MQQERGIQTEQWQAYAGLAETYDRYRPRYPDAVVQAIAERTQHLAARGLVLDVGCGTGIFTRLLAQHLPFHVIGVEPNDDMRRQAAASSSHLQRITFETGAAEELPRPLSSAVLVTAATAAHWFDRDRFYPQAACALQADGILALVQNKRRYWDSALLAAYEGLHEKHVPEYRRGTFPARTGGYAEADFVAELGRQACFDRCERLTWQWEETLTRQGFLSFSLSSSITQKAIRRSGRAVVLGEVEALLDRFVTSDDIVPVPYVTELTVAVRR